MIELSMLESQDAELLPAREALQGHTAALSIVLGNAALALPQGEGDANATADQTLVVLQSISGGDDD